jgi:putative transposase
VLVGNAVLETVVEGSSLVSYSTDSSRQKDVDGSALGGAPRDEGDVPGQPPTVRLGGRLHVPSPDPDPEHPVARQYSVVLEPLTIQSGACLACNADWNAISVARARRHIGDDVCGLSLATTPSALEPLTISPSAWILPGSMLRLLVALLPTLFSAMRSRRHLVIENLALRQQLTTLAGQRHPDLRPADRVFWILLRRSWSRWAEALAIVRPDTIARWHRAGLRIYWNWLSRRGKRSGRPPLPREVRALIRRMATENPWGAPRTPRANATWRTFLRNRRDGIAAMEFFAVPTAMFGVLHVFLVIRHGRRDVVRCSVTTSPTAAWVAQQLRETFPFESAPRLMIFDRDAIFSAGLTATTRSMLMEPTCTSYRSPWQNGVAERFVGTVRRELLDHVIVLNARHLRQLIESFVAYYNAGRTHLGVGKDSPCGRPVEQRPGVTTKVVSLPRVGGLHHHHAWRQAA